MCGRASHANPSSLPATVSFPSPRTKPGGIETLASETTGTAVLPAGAIFHDPVCSLLKTIFSREHNGSTG